MRPSPPPPTQAERQTRPQSTPTPRPGLGLEGESSPGRCPRGPSRARSLRLMTAAWALVGAVTVVSGTATAAPVEVADVRKVGVGGAAGFPPTATVKLFADLRNAIAFHVGPTLATTGIHTRIVFEQSAGILKEWDWGELWLTWQVGVVANVVFGQAATAQPVRLGVTAGAGVELRLAPVPVAVFGELAPTIYPLDFLAGSPFLPAGLQVAGGARWYIGRRRRPEVPVVPAPDDDAGAPAPIDGPLPLPEGGLPPEPPEPPDAPTPSDAVPTSDAPADAAPTEGAAPDNAPPPAAPPPDAAAAE
jgi:hypothetical protein